MRFPIIRWVKRFRTEPAVIAGVGLLALILLLAKIVEDVVHHESGAFDRAILFALRTSDNLSVPIGPHWFETAMLSITDLGNTTILTLVTTIACIYLWIVDRRGSAMLVAASVGLGALFEHGLKLLFARPRPDLVPQLVSETSLSFPSGHAMLSAITYLTLGALLARAQGSRGPRLFVFSTGVALTILIGFSRVYLGVHWPTDVLAGWNVGSIWVLCFWTLGACMQLD